MKSYVVQIEMVNGKSIVTNMRASEFEEFMRKLRDCHYADLELSNVEHVYIHQRNVCLIDILEL